MKAGAIAAIVGIILVMVAFVVFPLVMTGAHTILATASADEYTGVTTGSGVTTATVTLTGALYDADTAYVSAVTSSLNTDVPIKGVYTSSNKHLTITGLTASESRTLDVTYEKEATTDYTGLGSIVKISPVLLFIGLLFSAGFGVFKAMGH